MKKLLFILIVLVSERSLAQINIVPMPAEIKIKPGYCVIKEPVGFILMDLQKDDKLESEEQFKKYLTKEYKIKNFREGDTHSYGFPAEIFSCYRDEKHPEGYYEIEISENKIYVTGTALGKFYAFQTLKQLLKRNKNNELTLPHCIIKDYPRFPYRGMHLDVCRHFFTVAEVKKYIDYLAFYKFNTFHWHLTDDQGWRIEIKKYPLLTTIGNCRAQTLIGAYGSNKYDGEKYCAFYTQEQIKEVVRYAKERFITIIPEIEMPGHALAALTSYPYLGCTKGPYKAMETWGVSEDVFCAGNDSTYTFMQNVLSEVAALFPSKYIHIGGDECPKERWKTCPVCLQRMKTENLKNEHELQSYFIKRITTYLAGKGKKIIGWDEIMEGGIAPGATVMSWNGEKGGIAAAQMGHDAIMTPGDYCYFDHSQSLNEDSVTFGGYTPLEKVYSYDPVPAGLSVAEAKHIIGAQANVWTEYITNESKLEYTIFPRMAALAEVLWTPKEKKDWKSFEQRIPAIYQSYKARGINFSNSYYDLSPKVIPLPGNRIGWQLETKNKDARIIYRKSGTEENISYISPVEIKENISLEAAIADAKGNVISNFAKQNFFLNKASGKKIILTNEPAANYPGNGAFTLVDGVQNTKGMSKSSEFLGFNGKDLEAVIDFGDKTSVSEVRINTFTQTASWIYPPSQDIGVLISDDGINFTSPENEVKTIEPDRNGVSKIWFNISQAPISTRFIKVYAKNYGTIPAGQPGTGNAAWLFVDEIEAY
jgi:hexosaminidase